MNLRTVRTIAFAAVFGILSNTVCHAACGFGKTPAWSDIEAVRYVRTNCFGKCPSYEVLFWKHGFYYAGHEYVDMPGTYEAPYRQSTFNEVVGTLRQHDFFAMNCDSHMLVMDTPHLIVAVVRCGVTTKFDWPSYGRRTDVPALFDSLDAITKTIPWHKTSDKQESPEPLEAAIP